MIEDILESIEQTDRFCLLRWDESTSSDFEDVDNVDELLKEFDLE